MQLPRRLPAFTLAALLLPGRIVPHPFEADGDGYRPDLTSTVLAVGLACDGNGNVNGNGNGEARDFYPTGDCDGRRSLL